ncbi:uncharacterized protein BJ212DRAFT_1309518 [Suillus subaureus]|uniref:Uncharacterized protein n=1 Tax=Suillus subaureus TaxID=48587 RepID=A0A9P7JJN7_9AGAM|nr:uncharacterized protein BJ212DRAFT_1309518 [Suillus subaureus]KAG1826959.1 hypothetical protein BJ212DRAFT_1309518 [Suillus subaureus]
MMVRCFSLLRRKDFMGGCNETRVCLIDGLVTSLGLYILPASSLVQCTCRLTAGLENNQRSRQAVPKSIDITNDAVNEYVAYCPIRKRAQL